METVTADVWKLAPVVERFLGYRATIPLAQEQIGVMLTVLASGGQPINRFLDLGCGDGILGAAVLGRFPNCTGVLADFSEPMLTVARERLSDYASQLTFANIDYADPAWVAVVQPSAPFDAIVSGYSIHHQPDPRKRELYAEIFGLLSPGGWFINIEHVAPAAALTTQLFEDHVIDASVVQEQQAGGSKTRAQIAEGFHSRPDKDANILAPTDTQCNWLRAIGYTDVDCFMRIYELAVFGGRRPK
jgi:tRNA (cmo5U34)-methyltransferase